MQVQVIEVQTSYVVVEYEDRDGMLQRRTVPQGLVNLYRRGPASIADEIMTVSMDYATVDLVTALGDIIPAIQVRHLQDQLRRAGLWTRTDYQDNVQVVNGVWQRLRGVDVTRILNAAHHRHLD